MSNPTKILFIAFIERPDLLNYFFNRRDLELHLINYSHKNNIYTTKTDEFISIFHLNSNHNLFKYVKSINPDKIIFFEFSDFRLGLINWTLKNLGYTTIFLDHGIRDINSYLFCDNNVRGNSKRNKLKIKLPKLTSLKFLLEIFSINPAKNKIELIKNVIEELIKKNSISPLLSIANLGNKFHRNIIFSKNNLEVIEMSVKLDKGCTFFTGFPSSDSYFGLTSTNKNYIVFIEHPYLEEGIISNEAHTKMAHYLNNLSKKVNIPIYIKLHPKSNRQVWERYNFNAEHINIVDYYPTPNFYLDSTLIFSFSSTMLIPFLSSRQNVVLISWNLPIESMGIDFSKYGICHFSQTPEEIELNFEFWNSNNLSLNIEKWQHFINDYNLPFDGKATERVITLIQQA